MGKSRTALAERAMLVRMKTGGWDGAVIDQVVTDEVGETHEAGSRHGKYTKFLLSGEDLKEVQDLRRLAVQYHNSVTLPWQEPWRLLPIKVYDSYKVVTNQFIEDRIRAREQLIKDFPDLMEAAKDRLGSMYDPDEYPEPTELRERFYINIFFQPVPDKKHFVADLPDEEREAIADQIQQQIEERIAGATRSLYTRLKDVSDQAMGQLEKGTFRKNLFERIGGLVELIPQLNITNDPRLNEFARQLQHAMENTTLENLRESNNTYNYEKHNRVTMTMSDLQNQLAGYFSVPPDLPKGEVSGTVS